MRYRTSVALKVIVSVLILCQELRCSGFIECPVHHQRIDPIPYRVPVKLKYPQESCRRFRNHYSSNVIFSTPIETVSDDEPNAFPQDFLLQKNDVTSITTVTFNVDDRMIVKRNDVPVPTYQVLVRYLSTVSLIWLSEPLLSLIDTTCISLTQRDTALVQLAAMGPATTYMDTALYLTYFLAICVTNQIGELLASKRYRDLQLVTSRLLGVSLVSGGLVTLVTLLHGSRWMTLMVGTAAVISSEIIPSARAYCAIRSLVAPLSVVGMVAQSFCLVTQHTHTVVQSVVIAAATNMIGDAILTPNWGMQGAAVATAIASSCSTLWLLRQVRFQMKEWRTFEYQQQPQSQQTLQDNSEGRATSLLLTPPAPVAFVSLPDKKEFRNLLLLSFPLCFRTWAIMGSYALLTLRTSDFGAAALAAQNILVRVFYFGSAIGDSFSSATQTFLPRTLYPTFDRDSYLSVMQRLTLLASGAAFGSTLFATSVLRISLVSFLTRHIAITELLQAAAPYLSLSLLLHPLVALMEGWVITQRDFGNIVKTYSFCVFSFVALLYHPSTRSLADVWRAMTLWQLSRCFNYWLWRRRKMIRSHRSPETETETTGRAVQPI